MHRSICYYIPAHMLAHINLARAKELVEPGPAQQSAKVSEAFRQRRQQAVLANLTPTPPPSGPTRVPPSSGGRSHGVTATKGSSALAPAVAAVGLTMPVPGAHARLIYDDQNQWAFDVLDIRNEDDPAVAGQNVNLAYDALGATLEFYRDVLGRNSIDTQDTAGLQYSDQPGALNEATSDIFGACIDARVNHQDAGSFNWLIGEGVMAPQLYGEAIRSMAYPGTAYDNPILGTDPQPATMAGYVPGGDPHLNSGIINRWFYLMATDLGMDEAAKIWYATLQNLWPTAQFADAAQVAAAQARILARDGKVPTRAPQTVRGTAREQGII